MPANPRAVAENVLGTIGTVCWTGQIIPQIVKSRREHSTEGLSAYLVFLWAISAIFLGVYNVAQDINIPLIVQPQLFGIFSAVSWTQCLYYSHRRSLGFCALMLALYCTIGGGFQVGMIFVTKHEIQKENLRPVQFFGIMTSVIIATGLLPQYWEIWKRKEVVGVSYFFIAIDTLGGIFSLLSLVFKSKFDTVAAVTYAVVVVMDSVVLLSAAILNPRARRRLVHAQAEEAVQEMEVHRPAISYGKENTEQEKHSPTQSS